MKQEQCQKYNNFRGVYIIHLMGKVGYKITSISYLVNAQFVRILDST